MMATTHLPTAGTGDPGLGWARGAVFMLGWFLGTLVAATISWLPVAVGCFLVVINKSGLRLGDRLSGTHTVED